MSNFVGVTFAEQKVTPSDDAIIRQSVIPDSILTGCAMTYSGYTLTMAPGFLLIAGREIRHTATDNWAVTDATSGYARLVLTIDLTLAATKDSFEQVTTAIQYASSVSGFSGLTQADINGTGTKYQVVICVVSLGTGGITGIASRLGSSLAAMNDASRLTKGTLSPDRLPTIPFSKLPTGLLKRVKVWENASPGSAFGATTVNLEAQAGHLNVIKWDIVYISAAGAPAATTTVSSEYDAPGHRANFTYYGTSPTVWFRQCSQVGTTFGFEPAKANGADYNNALVPWRIYAWYLNLEE